MKIKQISIQKGLLSESSYNYNLINTIISIRNSNLNVQGC